MFTKTCVAPLDRSRIIAQTGVGGLDASGGLLRIFRNVIHNEGLRGLWKGNVANCARVFPSRGILFACNDVYKDVVRTALGTQALPAWASFASGAMAGTTSNALLYPLDFARTQMAASIGKAGKFNSVSGTLMTVIRERGFRALYHGMSVTLLGTIVYEGCKFGLYDVVRSYRDVVVPPEPSVAVSGRWSFFFASVWYSSHGYGCLAFCCSILYLG